MSTLVSSSAPSFVLLGASTKSMCLKKLSHPSSLSRQVKWWFYLQNYNNYNISNSSCCPHADPQHPLLPKKEQTCCHLACHNHLYPTRWLLLATNCRLGLLCTWYCHIISSDCKYRFSVFSLWFCVQQKLFQVSVKCLYDAPDQPAMLINGVWTWNKLHWLNVSPCKWNIVRTCWYPYHIFPISVCSVLRWFWDIYLVVDELSTYTKKATHWDKVLSSGNQV